MQNLYLLPTVIQIHFGSYINEKSVYYILLRSEFRKQVFFTVHLFVITMVVSALSQK